MKKLIFGILLFLIPLSHSYATVNTLTLANSYVSGSKRICVYQDSRRTEIIEIKSSQSCPSKKTFK